MGGIDDLDGLDPETRYVELYLRLHDRLDGPSRVMLERIDLAVAERLGEPPIDTTDPDATA